MFKKTIDKFCKKRLITIGDFNNVIADANEKNIINSYTKQIIEGALQSVNLKVRDVMVPKVSMVVISNNLSFKECIDIISSSAHSRFPIIDKNDKVIGIILAKDLLSCFINDSVDNFNYRDFMREAISIPETQNIESLLKFFQQKRSHLMIAIDEYGEVAGLITLEDVLEQIVGEIEDEHDFEKDNIIDYGKGRFLVKAQTSIEDFNSFFNLKLTVKNTDTIAGLVIKKIGYLPKQLERATIDNIEFKILKVDNRKIRLLEVKIPVL